MVTRSRAKLFHHNNKPYLVIDLDVLPNMDHIETVSGSREQFYIDWELADKRKASSKQRRLFFALLNDIVNWFVVPKDFLKDMFYLQYESYTGKEISLADGKATVSEVNQLLDLVIDFMFEWNVPFQQGYELLPKEERFFLYQCCRHRVCLVCGNKANIHHIDTVGMGNNRNHIDHSQRRVMPLCREHHQAFHKQGPKKFAEEYHVPADGIKLDKETLKKLGVTGIQ